LSGAPEQRDWNLPKDQNSNREKARAIRARQRAIGRELRRMFDDIAQEPIPDDFLDLLKKIDETEGNASKRAI
jgi:Anti-sigma factor NepR